MAVCLSAGIGVLAIPYAAQAFTVQQLRLANAQAVVITVDIKQQSLQLFLKNPKQQYYHSFNAINQVLKPYHQRLTFAMNAGMYHPSYAPVGLYIAHGQQENALNTQQGAGNFFMQPNGVFLLGKSSAQVISTQDFAEQSAKFKQHIELATQSGPLLVYKGNINANFKPDSTSRFIRNAVGVNALGNAVFVITNQPVNFYELARFFKNELHIDNALYLDGTISSLYLPAINRNDQHRMLGPIIGIVESQP